MEAGVGRIGEARLAHQSPVGQQGLDTVAAEGRSVSPLSEREVQLARSSRWDWRRRVSMDSTPEALAQTRFPLCKGRMSLTTKGRKAPSPDCISQEAWSACIVSLGERRKRPLLVAT